MGAAAVPRATPAPAVSTAVARAKPRWPDEKTKESSAPAIPYTLDLSKVVANPSMGRVCQGPVDLCAVGLSKVVANPSTGRLRKRNTLLCDLVCPCAPHTLDLSKVVANPSAGREWMRAVDLHAREVSKVVANQSVGMR